MTTEGKTDKIHLLVIQFGLRKVNNVIQKKSEFIGFAAHIAAWTIQLGDTVMEPFGIQMFYPSSP